MRDSDDQRPAGVKRRQALKVIPVRVVRIV